MATMNRDVAARIPSESLWSSVAEDLKRITVQIVGPEGSRGAGVVWRADGLILTNAHVVRRAATVRLSDGRVLAAEIEARDARLDLAALRIPASGLPSASIRDSRTLRAGEMVIAVGHPFGETGAISVGLVHGAATGTCVETDVRLLPGNSGGPLADAAGRVVGINCMVVNGIGVAVSTAAIAEFLTRSGALAA
jgi:serine protease Do